MINQTKILQGCIDAIGNRVQYNTQPHAEKWTKLFQGKHGAPRGPSMIAGIPDEILTSDGFNKGNTNSSRTELVRYALENHLVT